MKFARRLDEPLAVIATNAIHSGTSQKSDINTHATGLAVAAHSAATFIAAGSTAIRSI